MEFDDKFKDILTQLEAAENLENWLWTHEHDVLEVIGAERLTIYQKDANDHEIVAWFRSSHSGHQAISNEEIRVNISPSSVAGYVAFKQEALMVDDAYDAEYLESIHPDLHFDDTFDRASGFMTEAMITLPILYKDKLYGVIQFVNNNHGGPFPDEAYYKAVEFGRVIAEKFRYELKSHQGPYDMLVQEGLLKMEMLEKAELMAEEMSRPLTQVLREKFDIKPEDIGRVFSNFYQVPYHHYDPSLKIDPVLINNLNIKFLSSNYWVPLISDGERAIILMADPANEELILEIQNIVRAVYYDFHFALAEDILRYLGLGDDQKLKDLNRIDDLIGGEAVLVGEDKSAANEGDDILDGDQESKIISLVNKIIAKAKMEGSSDIHIEPHKGSRPGEVRFRLDGTCRKVFDIPASLMRPVISRIKILSNLDIAERRKPQDGKMGLRFQGQVLELRVATLPTVNGESVVMRILAAGQALPFDKLQLRDMNEKWIREMMDFPHGIILVVGPTGSGKTTTLHAILGVLNDPENKILTAEDPVEITQPGLQQVQMAPRAGLTFAIALRAFLRCDPDIILIGEMRDEETAHAGIEASLTGHLVLSTLHTNSAPETIVRLLDIGLDPLNFADALVGVVAQRLVRTLCSKCKAPHKPSEEDWHRLQHYYGESVWPELNIDMEQHEIMKAVGCDKCSGGYRGRVGVHEALMATYEMKKLVAKAAPVHDIRAQAIADGMRTLMQDGIHKIVIKQLIDLDELRKNIH